LKVFQEATSWGKGGEVVLRCGADTGRVFFAGGKIAWATVSTIKKTFTQYLVEQTSLGDEEAKEAFEDCKRTGRNFGETIVEWGLIDEASLRQLLLQHMSATLLEIFCWPDVESMFMPDEKPYKGSLTFDFMEILQTVLILDAEGRLPFKGLSAAQILDDLESDEVTETATPALIPESTAIEPSPVGMRPPTQPAITPLSGELEAVTQPAEPIALDKPISREEPILLTDVKDKKDKKGKGGLIVFLILIILAAGVVAAYFFREEIFGEKVTPPPPTEPQPFVAEKVEEPQPVVDAGTAPDEPADAGIAAADEPKVEPEPAPQAVPPTEPEIRPGIVAFAQGKGAGSIRVVSKPRKARIYLDGVNTGKFTPYTLKDVPAGRRHVILVEKKGRRPAFGVVDLEADQQALANLNLRRRGKKYKGRIPVMIESEPPGATIFVEGGKLKKETPTEIRLKADRSARLEVVLSGHDKWVRTVRPVPGMDITILVKFTD
jgi:hypothetical protein